MTDKLSSPSGQQAENDLNSTFRFLIGGQHQSETNLKETTVNLVLHKLLFHFLPQKLHSLSIKHLNKADITTELPALAHSDPRSHQDSSSFVQTEDEEESFTSSQHPRLSVLLQQQLQPAESSGYRSSSGNFAGKTKTHKEVVLEINKGMNYIFIDDVEHSGRNEKQKGENERCSSSSTEERRRV